MTQEDPSGADLFVSALERYGVDYLFGNPGTTELPVMRALEDSDVEYVLGLHEDVAVGMAAGYVTARRSQQIRDAAAGTERSERVPPVGVVNLHVAPGLAHGLGNLYNAAKNGLPLVITAGNHATNYRHEEPVLGGDLARIAEPFVKWSDEVSAVEALPAMVRRAVRTALSPPTGPVFLSLPLDVMMAETADEPERLGRIPSAGRGDADAIAEAADLLVDAEEPVLVVGDGVARNGREAIAAAVDLAEAAGARVHGEILASEVDFPTDHPQWVSNLPAGGDVPRRMMETDILVLAGTSTNTPITRPDEQAYAPDTRTVQVGDDPWQLGKHAPADAAVIGDPADVLTELAELVRDRVTAAERDRRIEAVREMKRAVADAVDDAGEGGGAGAPRASKAQLVDAMRSVAPDALVVDEGITTKYVFLSRAELEPGSWFSNKGAGLGYGLSAAVGAALAEEDRDDPKEVLALVGDGSYLYYPHAMYSAARYDLDLTVVVSDNRNYRILKDNVLSLFGGEETDHDFVGMDFDPPADLPGNARSMGADAQIVDDPDDIPDALEEALATSGPSVLDVLVHD